MISVSKAVEKIISGKKMIENNVVESGDKVYKIENLKHNKNGYLKIEAKEKLFGINNEYEVYKFLSGKIKVPELYYYDRDRLNFYIRLLNPSSKPLSIP